MILTHQFWMEYLTTSCFHSINMLVWFFKVKNFIYLNSSPAYYDRLSGIKINGQMKSHYKTELKKKVLIYHSPHWFIIHSSIRSPFLFFFLFFSFLFSFQLFSLFYGDLFSCVIDKINLISSHYPFGDV